MSSDRPRPLSAFWGGLGSKSSSPKSEPVVPKGYKLKHSYGGSTGHLDAYGAGMGGGMRPAVSMPVVAAAAAAAHHLPVASPSSRNNTTSSSSSGSHPISGSNNINKHHRHQQHRNSLPPALIQHPSLQQRPNQQRPPSRAISTGGLTSRMVKTLDKKKRKLKIKTKKATNGTRIIAVCANFPPVSFDDRSVNVT